MEDVYVLGFTGTDWTWIGLTIAMIAGLLLLLGRPKR